MSYPQVEPGAVLLLHGVGLGPQLFDRLRTMLTTTSVAPLRPPYAGGPVGSVAEQAADLAVALADTEGLTVVGVSGGATLALALAQLDPPGVDAIVAHEPLVGPLATELHAVVNVSAARLLATPGADGAVEFVGRLAGHSAWDPDFARQHADVVRAEVPEFAGFAVDPDALAASGTPVLVTTGANSHARRHVAAAALAAVAPVRTATVSGSGHLVHVDRPPAFAALVEAARHVLARR